MKEYKNIAFIILLAAAFALQGQQFRVDKSVTGSGGAPTGSGNFQINATVGQANCGVAQIAVYISEMGFWYSTLPQPTQFTQEILSDWNLIGLPLEVINPLYLSLYPNAIPGTLFGFNGSYYPEDSLELGKGYWLRFPAAELAPLTGFRLTGLTLDVLSGWNMISGISCNVALNTVQDPGGIIIPGTLFEFTGSYQPSDTIRQGKGYWLRASSAGQITLRCGAESPSLLARKNKAPGKITAIGVLEEESPAIKISDGSGSAQTLLYDVKLENPEDKLSFSMPPLPPKGAFDARFNGDLRMAENDESVIQIQSARYPVTISTANLPRSDDYIFELKEIVNGEIVKVHQLTDGGSIQIINPEVKTLALARREILPVEFALAQNYPNPFNPSTTILFSLPREEKVTLKIFNIIGEEVLTLVSGQLPAGHHSYVWNAAKFASGVYFYRLNAGADVKTKKLVSSNERQFLKRKLRRFAEEKDCR